MHSLFALIFTTISHIFIPSPPQVLSVTQEIIITPSPTIIVTTPTLSPKHTIAKETIAKKLITNSLRPLTAQNKLITEVNALRASNQKTTINTDIMLCTIATKRVNELITLGNLDAHAGFQAYVETIKIKFNHWGETLFWSSSSTSAHDIVFTYWENSPGHKETLLSEATHGCGVIKQGFAVFIVGKKK